MLSDLLPLIVAVSVVVLALFLVLAVFAIESHYDYVLSSASPRVRPVSLRYGPDDDGSDFALAKYFDDRDS